MTTKSQSNSNDSSLVNYPLRSSSLLRAEKIDSDVSHSDTKSVIPIFFLEKACLHGLKCRGRYGKCHFNHYMNVDVSGEQFKQTDDLSKIYFCWYEQPWKRRWCTRRVCRYNHAKGRAHKMLRIREIKSCAKSKVVMHDNSPPNRHTFFLEKPCYYGWRYKNKDNGCIYNHHKDMTFYRPSITIKQDTLVSTNICEHDQPWTVVENTSAISTIFEDMLGTFYNLELIGEHKYFFNNKKLIQSKNKLYKDIFLL